MHATLPDPRVVQSTESGAFEGRGRPRSVRPEFTIADLLANSAAVSPQRQAIVDGTATYTYADLDRQATALAGQLIAAGVRLGDRVGVYLEKCWEAVVAVFAVARTGAAFVNINPLLRERQVAHIVGDAEITVILGASKLLDGMALPGLRVVFFLGDSPPALDPAVRLVSLVDALATPSAHNAAVPVPVVETDLATILYTSGSTGLPKGIAWSHHNLVVGAQIVSTYLENRPDDRVLSVLPFSFDYGLSQLTTMVRVGGTLVLQRSVLPGAILRSLREHRITGLAGVPSVWTLLLQSAATLRDAPLEELRYITNSGGMVPRPHVEALRRLLPSTRIYLMYGLTEAFRSTFLAPEEVDRRPGSIGKAIPNTEIWILDDAGRECEPGVVGELVHRGPTVALGYWNNQAATDRVYRPHPFAPPGLPFVERVVYSGDLVTRDEDGFLYYVGRRDEQIKTGGYRVSPNEIEELVSELPWVRQVAAFGLPDPRLGQQIAVVVATDGTEPASAMIRSHVAAQAPSYLVPSTIEVLDRLPLTPTGKIDRPALKAMLDERVAPGAGR